MTKYQEALDKIKYLIDEFLTQGYEVVGFHLNGATEPLENFIVDNIDDDDLEILQELIDKEKGIYVKYTTTGISYCGNCNNNSLHNYLGSKMIYCSKCGYKINWGKDK